MGYLVVRLNGGIKNYWRYEVSLRKSYRQNGKVKKKETYLMTYHMPWLGNKSPHPQLEREYPEQWNNVPASKMKYFIEDKELMKKIIVKIKQAEKKRLEIIEYRKHMFDFWVNQIKKITDTYYEDNDKRMDFFHFVNRYADICEKYRYCSKEFYENNEQEIRSEIEEIFSVYNGQKI